ncbi:hypothetical protein [Algoriphagus zhangzhouensis]|uniref:Outer membrane insertion C-terminal signal n=1 Tax=Algoriphagus zhangzhouensis TaxID=1073327 RepID=A0A1M7ZAZ0_9BACT|nr:hypothetical protein [Algoriphagus zhangzhouensis]TDY46960.1 hypothetical protein A8938_1411 [Algoriphagus zhangzhouensis]SHO62081.1 hypothetical protein SAMN04488108_1851 [Algoriphagus zhangzhouensis]
MKKVLFLFAFCTISTLSFAQWGVSYHQSNLPFIGINTQLGEKWLPEFRIGTDNYVENLGFELVANYLIKSEESTQIYVGAGARANIFGGAVITSGINYYPFNKKDFGFHMEAAPLINVESGLIFRGSFGIRYRFLKE